MRRWMWLCVAGAWAGCAATGPSQLEVHHVVVCWLKESGDPAAQERLIETSYGFRDMPGVRRVAAGRAVPSDRPGVDASFDVAVILTFDNEQALRAYETNARHLAAVQTVLKPLTRKVQIFDIR